ncbi:MULTISPECIES: 6-pyruvoyl trahydropterin synthase family protein [Methylomonas]|uniref:6-carboxy-5,6,7,8-tetrahydropterin synthase n=1 Tax=Methylomonas koyamae TaxID=702114 RepID=A0A177NLB5_9GAMM|nr:6-carboxytetrahydropterin synthase [Methylomonas koyamae]OAI17820.1 6-pyruvoyl tetrahydropterin synthase [Methylomonas koyamae]
MYSVAVSRDFIANHYLIGGDWGSENQAHAHHYIAEVRIDGETLDRHGYLVDIVAIEAALDAAVADFRDRLLNDCPEFAGLNPSIEHFSRILCQRLFAEIQLPGNGRLRVKLWENPQCWAAFSRTF